MKTLWKGNWRVRVRIASGLVLFVYVLLHFLNIGFGLISLDLAEDFQGLRKAIHRSFLGSLVLYGAFLLHAGLALWRLARRRTLRVPVWEWIQVALGLLIPFLLITHIVHTRLAHEVFLLNDEIGYLVGLIWNTNSGWKQAALLLITWTHGCMGLHFWLRTQDWWRKALPALIAVAALVPAWALAGFMVQGRCAERQPCGIPTCFRFWRSITIGCQRRAFGDLARWTDIGVGAFEAVLLTALWCFRWWRGAVLARRGAVRIKYVSGPEIARASWHDIAGDVACLWGVSSGAVRRARALHHVPGDCGGRCRTFAAAGARKRLQVWRL